MKTCCFCEAILRGQSLVCVACGGRTCSVACLQDHADLKHPNASLQWSQDRKRPYLSISLLALMFTGIVLLLLLEPEMFIK